MAWGLGDIAKGHQYVEVGEAHIHTFKKKNTRKNIFDRLLSKVAYESFTLFFHA